jgi:hypothetical protein
VTQACVECLVISDCADKPGTVCSAGVCNCPNPANPAMPLTYCGNSTPACVDTTTSADNCGGCGMACFGCMAGKCTSPWTPTSTKDAPDPRTHHVAIWTGTKMFVWGGQGSGSSALGTGGLYDPAKNVWTATSAAKAPQPRWDATAVWDDVHGRVLVWGGTDGSTYFGNGGQYDPATDTWSPISAWSVTDAGAGLAGRAHHTAVWAKPITTLGTTTAGMIVWGGMTSASVVVADGGVYDPGTDTWVAAIAPGTSGPSATGFHAATWDNGARMVVFGGDTGGSVATDSALAYLPGPAPGTWNTTGTSTLAKRYQHSGVWDPGSMASIFFGGWDGTNYFGDAASLNISTWSSIGQGSTSSPPGRIGHSAVILTVGGSSQLAIFGGQNASGPLSDGWSVATSATGTWAALPTPGPSARTYHTAVSTGSTMIVWGGSTASGPTNTGGIYTAM